MTLMLNELLFVSFGAIFGASLRYLAFNYLPIPIILVNILGSFLAGISFARLTGNLPNTILIAINIGFLGSLTTFSSFSLETLGFLISGQIIKASFYILISVFVSLLCCYIGYKIGISL